MKSKIYTLINALLLIAPLTSPAVLDDEYKAALRVFMGSHHQRLGEDSPVAIVDQATLRTIGGLLAEEVEKIDAQVRQFLSKTTFTPREKAAYVRLHYPETTLIRQHQARMDTLLATPPSRGGRFDEWSPSLREIEDVFTANPLAEVDLNPVGECGEWIFTFLHDIIDKYSVNHCDFSMLLASLNAPRPGCNMDWVMKGVASTLKMSKRRVKSFSVDFTVLTIDPTLVSEILRRCAMKEDSSNKDNCVIMLSEDQYRNFVEYIEKIKLYHMLEDLNNSFTVIIK